MRLGEARLRLRYALGHVPAALRLPADGTGARREGLWRHSCFEAFLRGAGEEGYAELNLSPSGDWAAYGFTAWREGMRPLDIPPPRIEVRRAAGRLELEAVVDLAGVLPAGRTWAAGLSAVVEAADGSLSYWALAEAQGPPDFHHGSCFALQLPPPA